VREKDGLALSSRNAYLAPQERAAAPTLYRVLRGCAELIKQGRPIATVLGRGRKEIEQKGFVVDYLEARHAETLKPVRRAQDGPVRLLVAARIGKTRLIDNIGA
jgi:pantoate--beta-alanine ligase